MINSLKSEYLNKSIFIKSRVKDIERYDPFKELEEFNKAVMRRGIKINNEDINKKRNQNDI